MFHIGVVWVVTRPVFIEPGNVGPPMRVVFIQQPRAKLQPKAKLKRAVVAQRREAAAPALNAAQMSRADYAAPQSNPMLMVEDDAWDRHAATPVDGITFAHNPLASTYNPRPRPAPGRFRMRRQLSPEDIVRGVSQILGFWPPGYTDDPCAGLDKAVEMLMPAHTHHEQGLLADALREQEKYCM